MSRSLADEETKVTREAISTAYDNLPEYIRDPEIVESKHFSEILGCNLKFVNAHNAGDIGSFKDRGAYVKAMDIMQENHIGRNLHIIAASEGNHSQGTARVVRHLYENIHLRKDGHDVDGTIFMPGSTPLIKQQKTVDRGRSGDVKTTKIKLVIGVTTNQEGTKEYIVADGPLDESAVKALERTNRTMCQLSEKTFKTAIYDDALAYAKLEVAKSPDTSKLIHTFDDLSVIKGQGTLARSIERATQNHDNAVAITAIGGGGLSAGLSAYGLNVHGMQIAWMPSMIAAMCNGSPISLIDNHEQGSAKLPDSKVSITVDGATIAEAGQHTMGILNEKRVSVGSATATEIAYVFHQFMKHHVGIDVAGLEPSIAQQQINERINDIPELAGILPLVGAMQNPDAYKGKEVFCILSGGNISRAKVFMIASLGAEIEREMVKQGKTTLTELRELTGEQPPAFDHSDPQKSAASLQGWVESATVMQQILPPPLSKVDESTATRRINMLLRQLRTSSTSTQQARAMSSNI